METPTRMVEFLLLPALGDLGIGVLPRLSQFDAPSQDLESCMSDNSTELER